MLPLEYTKQYVNIIQSFMSMKTLVNVPLVCGISSFHLTQLTPYLITCQDQCSGNVFWVRCLKTVIKETHSNLAICYSQLTKITK